MKPAVTVTIAALVAIFVVITAPTARADRAAADKCATTLSGVSKTLYDQSLAEVMGGETVRDALTSHARGMVIGGSLSRTDARTAAEVAAPCLEQAR
jgi:hypothetical protein